MFGRKAATPIDSVLQMERTAGETVTYPEFVVKQREQIEATEQLVRESLGRAQTKQKTHYDKRSLKGQRYQVGDMVPEQAKKVQIEVAETVVWSLESSESPVRCDLQNRGRNQETRETQTKKSCPFQLSKALPFIP